MVCKGEKQMLRIQPELVAVSGLHAVGSWTLDSEPANKRNVVPTGSESLELSPIDPAAHQTLILVWTLQMGMRDCQRQLPASGHSNPRAVQKAPVFSLFANGTLRA
jgi:hypothetical protein